MPLTVRKYEAKVRDPNTGQMVDIGLLGSNAIGDIDAAKNVAVAVVTANGNVQVNRIVEAGTASITDAAPIYVPQRFGAKDNVITVYDDNLLVIGTLTGDYATTLLSGNLTIGARMGYGSGYTDFFKGVIRSFRVYDCAVPLRVIEKEFPSLDDNEASDKGAVTYYLTNRSHSYKLVRYAVVEITYDLGEFNRAEYEELYPQAFGIKMDGVYENATWVPCSASNKVRLIRLCKWDAICGPYESYKITIVNPGTVPGMVLKIKGIKAMLLSESETISEDSFDVTWKTDLDSLTVGGSVAGYISFTPKDAESRMTITASSEDTSVATISKSGSRFTVTGTGAGETDVVISSTNGEVKVFRVAVSGS